MLKKHIRNTLCGSLALAALALQNQESLKAQTQVYDAHLVPRKFSLYTDPYNGNEIPLGGFSGLYPVPGRPDRFYAITDRGPAPDFTDANGKAYKTWAISGFGPHLVTVDLQPNGRMMIREVMPLTRPDRSSITGLPTTKPATDVP